MIPKNVREGATAEGLTGQRESFTIEANGKAFKILIDGLYSNKIQAVCRELSSNAMDSHIDAGQDRPFEVSIPTSLDPVFRVRDFGTSLSHEDVMFLYTRIFKSTKEETNDQTGALGLGSKSPFAYTDTFSVMAYLNGERRVYVAFLGTDGVPCITHVDTGVTDEPNGLEVSFPARREDMSEFQHEMQVVALGHKPGTFIVHGMKVSLPEPRLFGKGWELYPSDTMPEGRRTMVRMGTVVYPIDQPIRKITSGYSIVIDIPIGTADPTASRETLSLDYETKTKIRDHFDIAEVEVEKQVLALVAAAGPSRVSIATANVKYAEILTQLGGSDGVSLLADRVGGTTDRKPGDYLENAFYFGKSQNARSSRWNAGTQRYVSSMPVLSLPNLTIYVVDQDVKMVRKNKRIQNASNGARTLVLDVPPADQAAAIKWITKCWELKPAQFVKASTLPDCPPPRVARGPRNAPRVLAPGQLWQSRREQRVVSDLLGWGERGTYFPDKFHQFANAVGFTLKWDDIFWVNERDEIKWTEKGLLPADRRLDNVLVKKMDEKVAKLPLDEAQTRIEVERQVGSYNSALPVVLAEFFPHVKIDGQQAKQVWSTANISGLDLSKRPILAKVQARIAELTEEFPLLFQKSGEDHFKQYVKAIRATTVKS